MDPHSQLNELTRRVRRIEEELETTKRQLANLADTLAVPSVEQPESPRSITHQEAVSSGAGAPFTAVEEPPPIPSFAAVEENRFLPPPAEDGPSPLLLWLRQIPFLSPPGEGNAEVRLGAWWATRLGAIFAVIGVVSFGVYISRGTPPWVKLIELLLLAVGLSGLGLWLQRRLAVFGAVVLGAGLASICFTAFAAYAVPGVKVIDSPSWATVWQFAAVALAVGVAWWKNAEAIATMAIGLGFVAVGFAFAQDLEGFTLVATLALAGAAATLHGGKGWTGPLWLAIPAVWLAYVSLALPLWRNDYFVQGGAWTWLAAYFGTLVVADYFPVRRGWVAGGSGVHWRQAINSSLAVLAGVGVAWGQREVLTGFYAGAGLVALGLAFGWVRLGAGKLSALYLAKGSGLLALAVITGFDARTRWLVLVVQVLVLLAGARRSGERVLVWAAAAVWLTASWLYGRDVLAPDFALWAISGGASILFLAGSVAAVCWFETSMRGSGRSAPGILAGLLLGGLASVTAWRWLDTGWMPALAIVCSLLLGWVGTATRSRGVLIAAGCVFAIAHLAIWVDGHVAHVWLNEAVLLVGGIAAVVAWRPQMSVAPESTSRGIIGWLIILLASATLVRVCGSAFAESTALACAAALGVILVLLAPRARPYQFEWAACWTVLVGALDHGPLSAAGPAGSMLAAALLSWLVPALDSRRMAGEVQPQSLDQDRTRELIQTGLALWFTIGAVEAYSGAVRIWVEAIALAVILGLGMWSRLRATAPALAVMIALIGLERMTMGYRQTGPGPLIAMLAVAVVIIGCPMTGKTSWGRGRLAWPVWSWWFHGIAGLGLILLVTAGSWAPLTPYATVCWGLAAGTLFALGLMIRERAFRLVGLTGIALCIPRLFLVDLDSTLYRIFAFAVLGGVLLWVGFSYERFRHLIAGDGGRKGDS